MFDTLIVGAGPAGAIAGLVAVRAGARVRIVDRAAFPRDKLCGDTINPGTLAILRRLGVASEVEQRGLRVDGMIVTGPRRARVEGPYPRGLHGRAILRRELDWMLLRAAIAAGCEFEPATPARRAIVESSRNGRVVSGVVVGGAGAERALQAPVVIAADGRHSTLAFELGLARHPARPRRWAIGAYFTGVTPPIDSLAAGVRPLTNRKSENPGSDPGTRGVPDSATFGEMHLRKNCYIGVAPLPDGLTNACVVREASAGDRDFRDPESILRRTLRSDPMLADRFASATLVSAPVVLGPLAVDESGESIDGLLVAGDAAGFVDPMTGDGLRFAIRGGELAAAAALRALEHGWPGVHASYRAARRTAFSAKWRFNRSLRALVGSPGTMGAAALGARVAPFAMRAVIAHAGDCHAA